MYIRYPNATATDKEIKVRVAGAVKTPTLNLTGITDAAAAKTKIRSYITELKAYATSLPSMYEGEDVRYPWDKTSSIYNATEIMTDQMLLSVPATAVVENLTGSEDAQVEQLYQNSLAMEQMMNITYTSKGLSRDTTDTADQWPGSRINIRYTRMFTGAFMYATGQHIGIEYGSVGGMVKGQPHQAQSDGTMADGQLYGWGIAHEIGHVTDEGGPGQTTQPFIRRLPLAPRATPAMSLPSWECSGSCTWPMTIPPIVWIQRTAFTPNYTRATAGIPKKRIRIIC